MVNAQDITDWLKANDEHGYLKLDNAGIAVIDGVYDLEKLAEYLNGKIGHRG